MSSEETTQSHDFLTWYTIYGVYVFTGVMPPLKKINNNKKWVNIILLPYINRQHFHSWQNFETKVPITKLTFQPLLIFDQVCLFINFGIFLSLEPFA